MVSLLAGRSFYPLPIYVNGEAAINNRTKGFSDEFRYNFEVGYTIASRYLVWVKANGVEPLRNGDEMLMGGAGGLFSNNQQFLAYGPGLTYLWNDFWGLSIGLETATRTQNTLSGIAYTMGFFLKR